MRIVTIGDATLYLGECLEIFPTLQNADACIADPPYGIGESGRKNKTRGGVAGGSKNTKGTYVPPTNYGEYDWDDTPAPAEEISACIASAKIACIWGGNYFHLPPSAKWLVWDKINSGDFADCEMAWTNAPGAARMFRHMWNGMLRASERNTPRVHPTQKPIALMEWCLQQLGNPKSVIDPYMGSAPVGVACVNAGISYVGIEREQKYFNIACERIEAAYAQRRLFA